MSKLASSAVLLSMFTACSMYAIFFPTLSPYLSTLQPEGTSNSTLNWQLGVAVSAYSAAKVVVAPLVGSWVSRVDSIYYPTVWLLLPYFVGNALYGLAQSWWMVFLGRLLVGVSATVSTVARCYIPRVTLDAGSQATLVGQLSAAITVGFVCGPVMSIVSIAIGQEIGGEKGQLRYTAGAYFAVLLGVGTLAVVLFAGRDRIDAKAVTQDMIDAASDRFSAQSTGSIKDIEAHGAEHVSDRLSVQSAASINGSVVRSISLVRDDDGDDDNSYSYTLFGADDANSGKFNWQMAGYLLIQLSLVTPFASFESILTPYAQGTYNATSVEVGLVFLAGSLITLPVLLTQGLFRSLPRKQMLVGQLAMALALLLMTTTSADASRTASRTASPTDGYVFTGLYCLFMVGYSVAQSMVFVDVYQTFGGRPELGLWLGLLSSVGSLGRMVGPLAAVGLFSKWGAGAVWAANAGLVAGGSLLTIAMLFVS